MEFDNRIKAIRDRADKTAPYYAFLSSISSEKVDEYSILTFFVGTGKHWKHLDSYKAEFRPAKYIVFHPNNETLKTSSIAKEGLTAFVARTGKPLVLNNRRSVEGHESFSGINEAEDNRTHPFCFQIAAIPISDRDGKVVGVLRCDIYDTTRANEFTEQAIAQLSAINDLICGMLLVSVFSNAFT